MNTLRWILGMLAILFGGGFVILVVLGNAFRKSFGASENGPLLIALPMIGLALLIGAILFPSCKPLMHLAAAGGLCLLSFCLWQIFIHDESFFWIVVAYLGAWFVFYWLAVWHVVSLR